MKDHCIVLHLMCRLIRTNPNQHHDSLSVPASLCSGPRVVLVGSTQLLYSQKPLLLYNGELTCQTASGKTSEVSLSSHAFLKLAGGASTVSPAELSKQLGQALLLKRLQESPRRCCTSSIYFHLYVFVSPSGPCRFHEAWDLCKLAGGAADWAELGTACLVHMEVELAIQVYRASGNVGMVLSLQGVQVPAERHQSTGDKEHVEITLLN